MPTISTCAATVACGMVAGAVVYGGYKLLESFSERGYLALGDYYFGDLMPGPAPIDVVSKKESVVKDSARTSSMQRKKRGEVDESLSDDPFNDREFA